MNEIAKCMEEAGNAPFVHNGIKQGDTDSYANSVCGIDGIQKK